jgi:hypothetical protein
MIDLSLWLAPSSDTWRKKLLRFGLVFERRKMRIQKPEALAKDCFAGASGLYWREQGNA